MNDNRARPSIRHVEVVIAVMNGENFLRQALESVTAQDFDGRIGCVVVDDGSTDRTGEIAQSFDFVRYHRQENAGQVAATNAGLSSADPEADAILFLDHDDLLARSNIRINAACLDAHPEWGAVGGAHIEIHGNAVPDLDTDLNGALPDLREKSFAAIAAGDAFVPPSSCLFRRETLVALEGMRSFPSGADLDLYMRTARAFGMGAHDAPVVFYRRHGENHSRNKARMLAATLDVLDDHLSGNDLSEEERQTLAEGKRHWISLFGPVLPMDGFWALKEGRVGDAARAIALWAQLGFPRR